MKLGEINNENLKNEIEKYKQILKEQYDKV